MMETKRLPPHSSFLISQNSFLIIREVTDFRLLINLDKVTDGFDAKSTWIWSLSVSCSIIRIPKQTMPIHPPLNHRFGRGLLGGKLKVLLYFFFRYSISILNSEICCLARNKDISSSSRFFEIFKLENIFSRACSIVLSPLKMRFSNVLLFFFAIWV